MRVNKLELNPDKTEVLLVSRDSGIRIPPVLEWAVLSLKGQVHNLGVLLDYSVAGLPDSSSGKECLCTVPRCVPAVNFPKLT